MRVYLRRILLSLLFIGIGTGAIFSGLYRCPFALLFGIPCPSCGMTRATNLALHGRFREAFYTHPLAFVLVPLLASYVAAHVVSYVRHGESHVDEVLARRSVSAIALLLGLALFVLWIARFFGALGGPVPV